jgi:hypothetical protein
MLISFSNYCDSSVTYFMNFNDQSRPLRRRCIHARSADVSAWGAHRRAIGRYIGAAPINCAPTKGPMVLGKLH